jgi:hypothetical protein
MATVQEYLIELGYSAEDAAQLAADEKVSKPIAAALAVRDEGVQARTQAQQQKAELDKWWKETAQPAILNADGGSAAAKAEAARLKAYMQTFVDQGYPVSEEIKTALKGDHTVTPATPAPANSFDPKKFQEDFSNDTARAMTKIYDLAEEYRELYGERMPNASGLLEEARSSNKPLTDYVRSKFNFDGKRAEISEKKIQDRIAAAVKEKEDALNAKAAERHNPMLAPAISSRAAQVREQFKDKADSWKTKVGRNEAKAERLIEFRNIATKTA